MTNDTQDRVNRIQSRVKVGAALLDEKAPGWRRRINLTALEQSSGFNCVVGQTFGDYITGCRILFGETINMELKCSHGYSNENNDWDELTEAWRQEILSETVQTTDDLLDKFISAKGDIVSLYLTLSGRPESDRSLVSAALAQNTSL